MIEYTGESPKFYLYRIDDGCMDSFNGPWQKFKYNNDGMSYSFQTYERYRFHAKVINLDDGEFLLHNDGMTPAINFNTHVMFVEDGHTKKIEDLNLSDEEKCVLILKYSYDISSSCRGFHQYFV